VADCIGLFSMDCPGIIPVDTHVFQIAQKFNFIKKTETLNDSVYLSITNAFVTKYGTKAGWAHQILFAGDLTSFKDKVTMPPASVTKKRKLEDTQPETQVTSTKRRKD